MPDKAEASTPSVAPTSFQAGFVTNWVSPLPHSEWTLLHRSCSQGLAMAPCGHGPREQSIDLPEPTSRPLACLVDLLVIGVLFVHVAER